MPVCSLPGQRVGTVFHAGVITVKIGAQDDFERMYMAKFRQIAAPYGIFVEYEADRAGRDIGLHFTQPSASGGKIVTPSLAWFQMKGIMPETLSLEKFKAAKEVGVSLSLSHLQFWFINAVPTYLVVYVGSADLFLAIDIKHWVQEHYGEAIFTLDQKTLTVKVRTENILDENAFRIIMERNFVASLRTALSNESDERIARFLRDSGVVKWLAISHEERRACRIRVIKYMSKMRTEVYFEAENSEGMWDVMRNHWQYSLRDIAAAFPYLAFAPKKEAEKYEYTDTYEDDEGEIVHTLEGVRLTEESSDWFDDDERLDYECLLELGNGQISYGTMYSGEIIEHEIGITLNDTGERWAATLKALEAARVISVSTEAHFMSVAPWHARDI
jgi:hypothetical protein